MSLSAEAEIRLAIVHDLLHTGTPAKDVSEQVGQIWPVFKGVTLEGPTDEIEAFMRGEQVATPGSAPQEETSSAEAGRPT